MLHKSNFSIEAAVANCSGAMEADTISKNGRSSKSHMSRNNFLKLIVFFIAVCTSAGAWGQTFKFTGTEMEYEASCKMEIDLVQSKIKWYDGCNGEDNFTIKKIEILKDNDILLVVSEVGKQFKSITISSKDIFLNLGLGRVCELFEHSQESEYKRLLTAIKTK